MKKITLEEFGKIIETRDVNIPLALLPIFNKQGGAWVVEGTEEEYRSAGDYFGKLKEEG